MTTIVPYKKCTMCGESFPATPENFYRQPHGLYGLRANCKRCASIAKGCKPKEDLHIPDGYKRCPECKQNFPANSEYFHRSKSHKSGLAPRCRSCAIRVSKEHYIANAAHKREYVRLWEVDNPEKVKASRLRRKDSDNLRRREKHAANPEPKRSRDRRYSALNGHKIRARQIEWGRNNPEKKKATGHRYRAKKRNLPHTLTGEQYAACLNYWEHRCAFCGRPQGLFHTIVPEHWIPISSNEPDNPGTVATNIIPACHGVGGCNNEKSNTDPVVWLTRKLGKRKANRKLKEILEYFEWISHH